jgi:hypothetical protein
MNYGRLPTSNRTRAQNVWEIIKEQNGTFEFFRNGQLLHRAIPDQWLEDQLGQYGFCGEEYREIRRKLDESGRARIVL